MGLTPSGKPGKNRAIVVIRKVKYDGLRVSHSCLSIYSGSMRLIHGVCG
jgi:hypothetical protein